MTDNRSVLIHDSGGLFLPLAFRLAREFSRVSYYVPNTSAFPTPYLGALGDGFDEIDRCEDFWEEQRKADLIVFPDVGEATLQAELASQGRRVWGSRHGDDLELRRSWFRHKQREWGLEVPEYEVVRGLWKLRFFLAEHDGWFIKVSKWRGLTETFQFHAGPRGEGLLDALAVKLGPLEIDFPFIVEAPIDAVVECFDAETEVLTEFGWKLIPDIRNDVKVATLNLATGKMEYRHPSKVVKGKSDTLYVVDKQKVNFAVTENHQLLVSDYRKGQLHFRHPNEITGTGFYVHSSTGQIWEGEEQSSFYLPPLPTLFKHPNCKLMDEVRIHMDDWLRFLGWFISEGCITRSQYTVCLSQSLNHPYERKQIRELLQRLPFRWDENGHNFRITNKRLYIHLLSQMRRGKRIPAYAKQLCQRQIRLLLDTIWEGDGSLASNGVTRLYHVGVDKRLADDIQECLLKVGRGSAVKETAPYAKPVFLGNRRIQRKSVTYIVSEYQVSKHLVRPSDIKRIPHNDWVYCVTVPNHTLFVRRKGKVMWSGNSGIDEFCIDGQFPGTVVQGIETKERCYLGAVTPIAKMPQALRDVNDALAPFLERVGYRNFFSAEVRITEDKRAFLIDPCSRFPTPAGECLLELIDNLGEVMWHGANGEFVEPVYGAQFAVQATVDHPDDDQHWRVCDWPEEVREAFKPFACVGLPEGRIGFPPFPWSVDAIGSVVAVGDTIEEALDALKGHAAVLEDAALSVHMPDLAETLASIHAEQDAGIRFTGQEVPEPAKAVTDA